MGDIAALAPIAQIGRWHVTRQVFCEPCELGLGPYRFADVALRSRAGICTRGLGGWLSQDWLFAIWMPQRVGCQQWAVNRFSKQ
jgi:hypothetical protein